MNKKGFTLIELLAVIVILALLALLTSTAITKLVKDSREELSNTQLELIKTSAEIWGAENLDLLPGTGECGYITLQDLKLYGLVNSSIKNSINSEEFSDDMIIKVTMSNDTVIPSAIYEVDPENVSTCKYIYEGSCFEYTSVDGGVEITNYLDYYTKNSVNQICSRDVKIPEIIDGNKVVSIGDRAFALKNLTSVEIPETITNVGSDVFYGNNLTRVEIPSSLKRIGNGMFGYNQLTNIEIPDSVETIGAAAFSKNLLTNITIPEGVADIESNAFSYNPLTSVEISSSVTSLGDLAFYNSPETITSVIIKGKTSTSDFASYGTTVFGWKTGYSDANIVFQN